jgi:hypothetical protein
MQTELASQLILERLDASSEMHSATMSQMRMWFIPQKSENEDGYSINPRYFEAVLVKAVGFLLEKGYVVSTLPDGVEDGDVQLFSLTDDGKRYLEQHQTEIYD